MNATPYYQDELVTLYHGSCLELTEWLQADVLVTDPPYGMAYRSNFSKSGPTAAIAGDGDTRLRDEALELWGPERAQLVFGTWRVPRPDVSIGRQIRTLIVWDKGDTPGLGDLSLPWGHSHEDVYVMGRKGFAKPGGKVTRSAAVIRANTMSVADRRRPDHPTPKPVALMERLLEGIDPRAVIADPFAGSGATLVAARNLGRRAIGVELEERYCDLIVGQLSQQAFDFGGLA